MPKKTSSSIIIQKRDFTLLRGLFESRVMTARHVSILYFNDKRSYTTKRLQKIKAAGLIGERKRNANEPSILVLTAKGFNRLKTEGQLSEYPALNTNSFEGRANVSLLTLRHEVEIMDVKTAFHTAMKSEKFSIAEFSTWPLLYQFQTSRNGFSTETPVKPDGFIRIHEREADGGLFEHTFYLEVDRSSKTQYALVAQATRYVEYYRSGGFAVRNGGSPDRFKEYPFRVLMVLKSAERRNNMAERLVQNNPPIFTQIWLTTFAEVTADPLGAIWIQPVDYRKATVGTPFETGRRPGQSYQRQTAREVFIEANVQKRRILVEDSGVQSATLGQSQ